MPAGRERCVSGRSVGFQEAEALTPHWGPGLPLFYSLAQTWELELALPACGPDGRCGEGDSQNCGLSWHTGPPG